jgi:hypothetical protein
LLFLHSVFLDRLEVGHRLIIGPNW